LCALRSLNEDPKCFNTRRSDEGPEPRTVEIGSALEVASSLRQVSDTESLEESHATSVCDCT